MADDLVERLHNVEAYLRFANRASVHADNVIEAATALESLRAENARLSEERDALAEASAYLIDRLTKVSGGIVVRDLEEARGSYDAALAKVKRAG